MKRFVKLLPLLVLGTVMSLNLTALPASAESTTTPSAETTDNLAGAATSDDAATPATATDGSEMGGDAAMMGEGEEAPMTDGVVEEPAANPYGLSALWNEGD
ncbi:MAG: hypothetical protein GC184_10485, partial [Rhizobiales bacterium]|nr:hypothetical protein [Hyphomicrobiales bacterium]